MAEKPDPIEHHQAKSADTHASSERILNENRGDRVGHTGDKSTVQASLDARLPGTSDQLNSLKNGNLAKAEEDPASVQALKARVYA